MSKCRAGEADSFCVARLHKLGATDFRSERVRTTDAQTPAISIRGLTKQYGSLTALKDLNLEVVQGEVLGFLGLNGAGKTTAIRLLLDLLRPTSGKAFIFGHDCWTEGLLAGRRWTNVAARSSLTGSSCRTATCVASCANTAPA